MQWPMPWLEALGLLAVVFAAGNGIGFGLSRLSGPRTLRKARPPHRTPRTPEPAPLPAEAVIIAEAPQLKDPLANATPVTETQAPVAETVKPETVVTAAAPPQPVAFTMRVRYSVNPLGNTLGNPFGALSVTRPNPDQPPN